MSKWDYKLHPLKYGQNPMVSEKEINFISQQGWEVVAVYNNPGAVILFRKKSDGKNPVQEDDFLEDNESPSDVLPDSPASTEEKNPEESKPQIQENAMTFYHKGSALLANSQFSEAIKCYDKAIEMDPNLTMAFVFRANAKLKLNDWEHAIEDFNMALILKPNDLPCIINRGICKFQKGDLQAAIEDFNIVVSKNPENMMAYEFRGQAKQKLKLYKEALDDYEKVLQLKPDDIEACLLRGDLKIEIKDLPGAIEDYTLAIKKDSKNAKAYYKRCKAKKESGDADGARSDQKKYNELCMVIVKNRDNNTWGENPSAPLPPTDSNNDNDEDIQLVEN